jgi:hypothetical protein
MGYYFPISENDARSKIREYSFSMWESSPSERINLLFISGNKSVDENFPLACLLRHSYLAIFSLPEDLFTKQVSEIAIEKSLHEFSLIDKQPIEGYGGNRFPIYRAYLGALGNLTIAEDLIRSGGRAYRLFNSSVTPKENRDEKVLRKIKIQI